MNAVEKTNETTAVEYSGGLLDVIARAARDPSVDIDKMERLIAMQERVQSREAEVAFNAALSELQPNLPVIDERGGIKDRNGNVQSTYALWEDVNEAIRPALAEHGFALRFRTQREGDQISVTGILSHRAGHKEETTLALPTDSSGSKNAVQAVGSSTSYGKRYTAFALLNITSTGEDDDGNKAGRVNAIDDDQLEYLAKAIPAAKMTNKTFCQAMGIRGIADLPAGRFDEAKERLDTRLANLAKQATQKDAANA